VTSTNLPEICKNAGKDSNTCTECPKILGSLGNNIGEKHSKETGFYLYLDTGKPNFSFLLQNLKLKLNQRDCITSIKILSAGSPSMDTSKNTRGFFFLLISLEH
jgi:hypothetical protein